MVPPSPGVQLILAACFLATALAARLPYRTPVFVDDNALSPVAKYGGQTLFHMREWARIKYSGPRLMRVAPGAHFELECEANGSPPPNVVWYHKDRPVTMAMEESNSIGSLRLGTVRTRLVVECATPEHQGSYECVATAGGDTAVNPPTLVIVQGNNVSSAISTCEQASKAPPRIVLWSPNMMETIGNDVILPCSTVGSPPPEIYWVDSQDNLITASQADNRFKVLASGELVISSVRWADMGSFVCIAESPLGRDTVTTFLYPMSKDR